MEVEGDDEKKSNGFKLNTQDVRDRIFLKVSTEEHCKRYFTLINDWRMQALCWKEAEDDELSPKLDPFGAEAIAQREKECMDQLYLEWSDMTQIEKRATERMSAAVFIKTFRSNTKKICRLFHDIHWRCNVIKNGMTPKMWRYRMFQTLGFYVMHPNDSPAERSDYELDFMVDLGTFLLSRFKQKRAKVTNPKLFVGAIGYENITGAITLRLTQLSADWRVRQWSTFWRTFPFFQNDVFTVHGADNVRCVDWGFVVREGNDSDKEGSGNLHLDYHPPTFQSCVASNFLFSVPTCSVFHVLFFQITQTHWNHPIWSSFITRSLIKAILKLALPIFFCALIFALNCRKRF